MTTRTTLKTVATTVFLLTATVQADIINVPADQPTIQAGIDVAVNGYEIIVAVGANPLLVPIAIQHKKWKCQNGVEFRGLTNFLTFFFGRVSSFE